MGERANRLEARCHSDGAVVYAADVWEESHASYPERSAMMPWARCFARGIEVIAEVSRGRSSEGPASRRAERVEPVRC